MPPLMLALQGLEPASFFVPVVMLVLRLIEPLLWTPGQRPRRRGSPERRGDGRRCSAGAHPSIFSRTSSKDKNQLSLRHSTRSLALTASTIELSGGLLRELGIEPVGKRGFLLADGRRIEMYYGQAWATIGGKIVVAIAVFDEDDVPALLRAYTLEGLALAVDPTEQRLVPTNLIIY